MAKELRFGAEVLTERIGALSGRVAGIRVGAQNGASVAGLLPATNTLVAEEQTPWGGPPAPMTSCGSLDEGLHQPPPDASTPQSLGLGPSVG